jgi:hypothetical protein
VKQRKFAKKKVSIAILFSTKIQLLIKKSISKDTLCHKIGELHTKFTISFFKSIIFGAHLISSSYILVIFDIISGIDISGSINDV